MKRARGLGAPVANYQEHDHPVQRAVETTLKQMTGIDRDLPYGVDGCTVPNFAVPLAALARAMAEIADPAALPFGRAAVPRRILPPMMAHPDLRPPPVPPSTPLLPPHPRLPLDTHPHTP